MSLGGLDGVLRPDQSVHHSKKDFPVAVEIAKEGSEKFPLPFPSGLPCRAQEDGVKRSRVLGESEAFLCPHSLNTRIACIMLVL